ncbi:MAG: cyclophane-forming radical SAM/SPASM peptide maturase YhhB [Neisseria sp.]|nr:cyclophane-forming radical SAM/SPASM peptide maturase YhhB [Neisseria sp.]
MIDTVLLKVASRCNLDCTYCYVYHLGDDAWKDNPKLFSTKIIDDIEQSLFNLYQFQGKSFAIVLHGGEPFLLPKARLEYLFAKLRSRLPSFTSISIQTNGLLLNNELIDLCYKYHVTISISLDGTETVNDKMRIDHLGRGSFTRIMDSIQLIKQHKFSKEIFTGCLAVINPFSNPHEIYHFFKQLNIPSVNFLMRDGNHDRYPYGKANFYSLEYAKWLEQIWIEYFNDENPIPIAFFDNYVKMLMGGTSSKEGTGTEVSGILIIDTNGDITKNDTLKSTENRADRFKFKWHVSKDNLVELIQSDEFKEYLTLQNPTSEQCQKCEYLSICGGGMPLYRWSKERKFDNPSVFCKDHQYIIHSISQTLEQFYENQS